MTALKQINGLFVEPTQHGKGANSFSLRTKQGPVEFFCHTKLPPMRQGDMISVILSDDRIVTICNFSTGAQMRYSGYPFKSEAIALSTVLGLALGLFLLSFGAFTAGAQASLRANGFIMLQTLGIFWLAGVLLVIGFEGQRILARNHNVALISRIEKMLQQACLDPNAWPEDAENENENWRDK
jgi:hypothetical protein